MPHSEDPDIPMTDTPPQDEQESEGDEHSSSEEDEPAMVVTRERRQNAGNRMSKLLALAEAEGEQQEEEEEYGEIFLEAADDVEFEGDEGDEQDFNMDSSSEEEAEGQEDEDQGEKELQKTLRQQSKKRKRDSLLQHAMKRAATRIAPVPLGAGVSQQPTPTELQRPRKKSERVSWLPEMESGPVRSSRRQLAVQNKQEIHERLKEKEKHRLKTVEVMKAAEARKEASRPKILTQEERLKEAALIERKNSKSLNRWETNEKRRAAEQAARLAALKDRKLEGPIITYWSGQSVWIDGKLKSVGKRPLVQEVEKKKESAEVSTKKDGPQPMDIDGAAATQFIPAKAAPSTEAPSTAAPSTAAPYTEAPPTETPSTEAPPTEAPSTEAPSTEAPSTEAPPTEASSTEDLSTEASLVQNLSTEGHPAQAPYRETPPAQAPIASPFNGASQSEVPVQIPKMEPQVVNPAPGPGPGPSHAPAQPFGNFLDGIHVYANLPGDQPQLQLQPPSSLPPPPPPPPPPQSHPHPKPKPGPPILATRNFIVLTDFEPPLKQKDPDAIRHHLFSWPIPSSSSSATATTTKKLALPKKSLCAITGQEARYRDPVTGLGYVDAYALKRIRRVVRGEMGWSALLGGFVGERFDAMGGRVDGKGFVGGGRPARGVPERFYAGGGSGIAQGEGKKEQNVSTAAIQIK